MSAKYAIVQHSGYGYAGDGTFSRAVESRHVSEAEAQGVAKAGGLVFDSYDEAENYAYRANYYSAGGLVPVVEGTFADLSIDGLAAYLPKRLTVDGAIEVYRTEKANVEREQATGPIPQDPHDYILKTRLTEIDTFLNVLQDMKVGH